MLFLSKIIFYPFKLVLFWLIVVIFCLCLFPYWWFLYILQHSSSTFLVVICLLHFEFSGIRYSMFHYHFSQKNVFCITCLLLFTSNSSIPSYSYLTGMGSVVINSLFHFNNNIFFCLLVVCPCDSQPLCTKSYKVSWNFCIMLDCQPYGHILTKTVEHINQRRHINGNNNSNSNSYNCHEIVTVIVIQKRLGTTALTIQNFVYFWFLPYPVASAAWSVFVT